MPAAQFEEWLVFSMKKSQVLRLLFSVYAENIDALTQEVDPSCKHREGLAVEYAEGRPASLPCIVWARR